VRFGIFLIVLGAGMAFYSYSLPVYNDEASFIKGVSQIGDIDAAQHFYTIQDQHLTAKYVLLDYSICSFLAGVISIFIAVIGFRNLKSPSNISSLVILGVVALGSSILAYYGDSWLNLSRNLSPPWSPLEVLGTDTLKKPLYFLIAWLVLHCIVLRKDFQLGKRFRDFSLDFIAIGLLSSTLLAGGFTVITIIGGQPIYVVPALLWFYFHLSLLAGKQSALRME